MPAGGYRTTLAPCSPRLGRWEAVAYSGSMDIPSFLRTVPPFDDLDDDRLAEVVRHTHIEFHPQGSLILQEFGEPSHFLYVVRRGPWSSSKPRT